MAEEKSFRLAVDCMGGDKGPGEVIHAVALVLPQLNPGDRLFVVGQEPVIRPCMRAAGIENHPQLTIVHSPDAILMTDKPMQALKSKKYASMIRCFELLKAGDVDAVISTGNTKVLVGAGTIKLRMLQGCQRPALTAILPRKFGYTIMVDVGANPETTPEQLIHNGILGALYANGLLGIEKPSIGLLTVGTEEGKGGERINKANLYMKEISKKMDFFKYAGPIEGFDIFQGDVDVIVCDGFTGNITLKSIEGLVHMLKDILSTRIKRNPLYIAAVLMMISLLKSLKSQLRPERFGGAPLLGLSGMVLKAHGSSNRHAIASAILMAKSALTTGIMDRAPGMLQDVNAIIEEFNENSSI
ncbi:MAG: phosphate acyltransferase PlsX [Opitutales bacterium]|nr:phosphate acyltransferase PlsX [Opitutales bacterium]